MVSWFNARCICDHPPQKHFATGCLACSCRAHQGFFDSLGFDFSDENKCVILSGPELCPEIAVAIAIGGYRVCQEHSNREIQKEIIPTHKITCDVVIPKEIRRCHEIPTWKYQEIDGKIAKICAKHVVWFERIRPTFKLPYPTGYSAERINL